MELGEIIKDALTYPTSNIKALLIYLILGFLIGVVAVFTGLGSFTTGSFNFGAGVFLGIIGLVIIFALALLMMGFSLDVIKLGINRSPDAPGIDFSRQVSNGLKYIIVTIVYMIIPIIIIFVLNLFLRNWITIVIGVILAVIFAFALTMAICRLAKTDSLGSALDISGAIGDIQEIGVGKVIFTLIVATFVGLIIVFILSFVLAVILSIAPKDIVTTVVTIVSVIFDAWLLFYENRVMGLLYSNIA